MTDGPWTLIANPAAGSGRGSRIGDAGMRLLRRRGREVHMVHTGGPGHAADLAARAVETGSTLVVVCGGDGSVADVLPALAGRRVPLGLLPCGTANDLARALGIPRTLRGAVRVLLEGQPRAIDLGRCGDKWFATVAAFGFDAEVSQAMASGKAPLPGTIGYLLQTLRHLRTYVPPRVRLAGDFGEVERRVFLAATANTRSYGGGMRIAPGADPGDGLFDLCLVDGEVSVPTVLSMLPRIFWGGHVRCAAVTLVRTSWVRIEPVDGTHWLHADGELLAPAPAELRVERHALRVLQPTPPAAQRVYRVAPDGL